MSRHHWTEQESALLAELYPDTPTAALAARFGLSISQVHAKANYLRLKKSPAFLASAHSGRLVGGENGLEHRFRKGRAPWNKGMKYDSGGRSHETRFKKGEMNGASKHNYLPLGSLRLSKDGYLERKVTDAHPVPARRWQGVHRLVWSAAHGEIPKGMVVVFRPGCFSAEEAEITLERLELISRQQLMRRNSVHNLPKELADLVQLRGALNRKLNRLEQPHEQ